jgi:hypothetical protein
MTLYSYVIALWDRKLESINATHPPCRIALNSVDIAAFIAKDDAEYLGAVAAITLIAGTAVMLRAVERSRTVALTAATR